MAQPSPDRRLNVLICRCAQLSRQAGGMPPLALLQAVRIVIDEFPCDLSDTDDLVCRGLVTSLYMRLVCEAQVQDQAWVVPALTAVSRASEFAAWRTCMTGALDRCVLAMNGGGEYVGQGGDGRVERVLRLLDARYHERTLSLGAAAAEVRMSHWHLSRLLRCQTGMSFAEHVRLRRVRAAQRLLVSTLLSAKEIAVAVGFGDQCQFSRQFKSTCGLTPVMFRHQSRRVPEIDKKSQESTRDRD